MTRHYRLRLLAVLPLAVAALACYALDDAYRFARRLARRVRYP